MVGGAGIRAVATVAATVATVAAVAAALATAPAQWARAVVAQTDTAPAARGGR